MRRAKCGWSVDVWNSFQRKAHQLQSMIEFRQDEVEAKSRCGNDVRVKRVIALVRAGDMGTARPREGKQWQSEGPREVVGSAMRSLGIGGASSAGRRDRFRDRTV